MVIESYTVAQRKALLEEKDFWFQNVSSNTRAPGAIGGPESTVVARRRSRVCGQEGLSVISRYCFNDKEGYQFAIRLNRAFWLRKRLRIPFWP
jgi:hypothetical protein